MKNTVFIRADGSSTIGMGHLTRCLAFSMSLKNEYRIHFVCRLVPDAFKTKLTSIGIGLILIKSEEEFLELITSESITVLDGYHFKLDLHKKIRKKGSKLICIDDLHSQALEADLLINHAPGVRAWSYLTPPFTQFALGPEFALLRPSFLRQATKTRVIEFTEKVLICLGGADPENLTLRILDVIMGNFNFKKIYIVTGVVNKNSSFFETLARNNVGIEHFHNLDEEQMLKVILNSDLAIVPASTSLFEVLACGGQIISGISSDNQRFVYEGFKEYGIFEDAGYFTDYEIERALKKVLKRDFSQKKLIDGNSGNRILNAVKQLSLESELDLRNVNINDLGQTYKWATNEQIRHFSFSKHTISLEEHKKWFNSKIDDPLCFYFISTYDEKPVGSVRFEMQLDTATISYLIDPKFHGRGFGKALLKNAIELMHNKKCFSKNGIKVIVGEVVPENVPSIKVFERFGFIMTDCGNKLRFEKRL